MTCAELLTEMESLGSEQMRRYNSKHGAGSHQYGLKLGSIRELAKKTGKNTALANELWATQNIDARLLACLIVVPTDWDASRLDALVHSIDYVQIADWFSAYVLKDHPDREKLRQQWMVSSHKWAARLGWALTAGLVSKTQDREFLDTLMHRIANEMPTAEPEVQWTQNTVLAMIGIHHPNYRESALALGEQLGLFRDYPTSKGCVSPFAPIWITEMVKRQKK